MKPSALLDESRVILGVPSSATKREVIEALVGKALDGSPAREAILEELLRREKVMSTGIGNGVAVPHAHTKLIEKPVAALAVSPGGIEWDAVDGEPVHIVLAFVTPDANPSLHVQTLGETSTLLANETVRAETVRAKTAGEILEVFRRNGG